jgi:hypothetical protein
VITVITGPPCSGKSTYARQNASPGDVIVDFDDIARSLGSAAAWDHDPRLREIAAAAWSAAVDRALASARVGVTAWIIDSRPIPAPPPAVPASLGAHRHTGHASRGTAPQSRR